jgi:hypothetical protein
MPEDSSLRSHRCENLKSNELIEFLYHYYLFINISYHKKGKAIPVTGREGS